MCFLRPLVAGPFVEKSSGAKFRVFFGHIPEYTPKLFRGKVAEMLFNSNQLRVFNQSILSDRPTNDVGTGAQGQRQQLPACQNPKDL